MLIRQARQRLSEPPGYPRTRRCDLARPPARSNYVAIVAAVLVGSVAGAGIYFAVEWGSPTLLRGHFANLSLSSAHWTDSKGHTVTAPIVSASLLLTSPLTLDPKGVVIRITGPNSTLLVYNLSKQVWVHQVVEVWLPDRYPHWMVEFPTGSPGVYDISSAFGVTFVNPDHAIVGGFNASLPSADSIVSGATMTVEFPGGPGLPTTASGFTISVTEQGNPGAVFLSVP